MTPQSQLVAKSKEQNILLKVVVGLLMAIGTMAGLIGKFIYKRIDDTATAVQSIQKDNPVTLLRIDALEKRMDKAETSNEDFDKFKSAVLGLYGLKPDEIRVRRELKSK